MLKFLRVTEVGAKLPNTSVISKSWSHDFIGYYGSGNKKLRYFRKQQARSIEFLSAVTEVVAKTLDTSVNFRLAAQNFNAGYGSNSKTPEYFRNPSPLQLWSSSILYPTFFTVRI